MKMPDEIKFRAPHGTKDRLIAVAKAKSKDGRQVTISDEARYAVLKHLNAQGKRKAKA